MSLNWTPYCGTAVQNWLYYSRKVLPFAREGDTAGWRLTRFTHADGSVSYWREGEPMTGDDAMRLSKRARRTFRFRGIDENST